MDLYIKNNKISPRNKIIVIQGDTQIINPTEEILYSNGGEKYEIPIPSEEEQLNKAKELKINEILLFDSSENVNEFSIGDYKIWLDKATRAGLMLRFQSEKVIGKTETTLGYNGIPFTLELESAFEMLYALENYASECYDKTQYHIGTVNTLTTIEEVDAYNFVIGYPNKLHF